jgi:hypothetical protein
MKKKNDRMTGFYFFIFIGILILQLTFLECKYEEDLYQMAVRHHEAYLKQHANVSSILPRVHLVRLPKAASTSLSMVARRAVGCEPPGPCCRWPGDPVGSCPNKKLFDCQVNRQVIGCTGHNPEINILKSSTMPAITMFREPISRSISAFFYPNHHNMECVADANECFEKYTKDLRFQNIAVKMISGNIPYANIPTCQNSTQCKYSLETAIHNLKYFSFIGIMEYWELSLLLFHRLFPQIPPSSTEFLLYATNSSSSSSSSSSVSASSSAAVEVRHNTHLNYSSFQVLAREKYTNELNHQNSLDIQFYSVVKDHFQKQLVETGLWEEETVQKYLSEKKKEQQAEQLVVRT